MWSLQQVRKQYEKKGSEIAALENVNFSIYPGEYISIVGPSGSGKTTLLLILGGMLSPSEGRYEFNGTSLYSLSPNERAKIRQETIGFVFQNFHLIPYLTALENVALPLSLSGNSENPESKARELLEQVGLGKRLSHKPSELSIGQQQRVAFARMMANDPSLILADEPTGNLNPKMAAEVIETLEAQNRQGKTLIVVTHDPSVAKRASRMITIEDGTLREESH